MRLAELSARTIHSEKEYRCKACENLCPIRIMAVGEARYHFGGRCNKFANLRRKPARPQEEVKDWVEVRRQLYFDTYAAPAEELPRANVRVGVPEALSVHSFWPLYSNFFHALGVRAVLASDVSEKGAARCESSFCYPGELAHGQMGSMLEADPPADFWFVPHLKALPSYEKQVHACVCPITQGLPYALRTAFELDDARLLRPVLDLTRGFADGADADDGRRRAARPHARGGAEGLGARGGAAEGLLPRGAAAGPAGGGGGGAWDVARRSSSSAARTTRSRPARTWASRASS